MKIKDRIRELRRVPARELLPNPKNWRTHPDRQRDALSGVLAEIGYADALLARETSDGQLQLIDGHLRAETTPNQEVPVLILDLDEKEAELLMTVLDPLSALAGTNHDLLAELVNNIDTNNQAVQEMLAGMTAMATLDHLSPTETEPKDLPIHELFQIIVQCENENEQRDVFEQLVAEGRTCRIANL